MRYLLTMFLAIFVVLMPADGFSCESIEGDLFFKKYDQNIINASHKRALIKLHKKYLILKQLNAASENIFSEDLLRYIGEFLYACCYYFKIPSSSEIRSAFYQRTEKVQMDFGYGLEIITPLQQHSLLLEFRAILFTENREGDSNLYFLYMSHHDRVDYNLSICFTEDDIVPNRVRIKVPGNKGNMCTFDTEKGKEIYFYPDTQQRHNISISFYYKN